jgi:hypothetical protein
MYLREVGWEGVDLMDPAQDRVKQRAVVSMIMDLSTQCHFLLGQNRDIALPTKRTSNPTLSRHCGMLGLYIGLPKICCYCWDKPMWDRRISRRIHDIVCFLLGNSPASEFYMPTFRNTLSVPSS